MLFDDFAQSIEPLWTQTCIGDGALRIVDSALRMELPSARRGRYSDAQIDDYGQKARSAFPWKPPIRMEVRARASHVAATASSTIESAAILRGTAGFGFWNYPFSVRGDVLMLPEAIWFFYASPPSNMSLVPAIPGWGWKAQVVHSMRAGAIASVAPLAVTATWARLTGNPRPAQRWLQKLSGASEALLPYDLPSWHTYRLEWRATAAQFFVDDNPVLIVPHPPAHPLGFVAWLDNQYAIATPRGVLRMGTIETGQQWLEIDWIRIEPC